MKKTIVLTVFLLIGSLSVVCAQTMTKQQALNEIARIEKFNEQVVEMLRQAWEVGRTHTDTIIDTPKGKVTIKFNLSEIISNNYTGSTRDFYLRNWHGEMGGNELRLNTSSWAFKDNKQLKIKHLIAHELGHHVADNADLAPTGKYRTVSDLSEINADAFAMRYMGKTDSITVLKGDSASQDYIDAVIKRAEEMEREERETLARLRNIAGTSQPQQQSQPQNARSAQSYYDSGNIADDNGDYKKAIVDFTEAIRIDPSFVNAYIDRAYVYNNIGDYNRAIADCNEAIRLDPNNSTVYNNRASSYFYKGDYDSAITDCNEAIRLNPNLSNAYYNRANSYMQKRNYKQARADVNRALQIDPNFQAAKDLARTISNAVPVWEQN